jgi:hypothetical protein
MPVLGCQGESVYDVVGQQHGVLSGNPTWDTNSIQFNGAGMVYVGLQRIFPTGDQPFTVSTRVRVASGQSGDGCCWTTNSSVREAFLYAYRASSSGRTRLFWRNHGNEVYVGSDIRGAGWCVLTMVYDGSTCKQYINGIYDTQGPASGSSSGIEAGFAIGAAVITKGFPSIRFQLTGHLDFTHIWPRDLLASEVAEHARDPLLPFRRRQPRRYYIPSAEPPSFNSAWATGNNHVIGAA